MYNLSSINSIIEKNVYCISKNLFYMLMYIIDLFKSINKWNVYTNYSHNLSGLTMYKLNEYSKSMLWANVKNLISQIL